tara:strand:- start:135 stop:944 length:810 start_codon:yes stop_codon:yes gene_type:complete
MFNIPSFFGFRAGSGVSYDPDALAFFGRVDAATATTDFLTVTEKDAVNDLVLQMKSDLIWTSMKAIYPMVGGGTGTLAQKQAACEQNLVSSSFTGTFSSGWTFASTGVTPTNAYMITGLAPSGNLSQNSAHVSSYIRGTNAANQIYMGSKDAGSNLIYVLNFGFVAVNNGDQAATNLAGQNGFLLNTRTSITNLVQYRNATAVNTLSVTSTGLNTQPIWIGAYNNNGAILFPSNNEIAFSSIGDGLSTLEESDFYTAVNTFQTTLLRNV